MKDNQNLKNHDEQAKIFKVLEKNLHIENDYSIGSLVHFQNAQQTPIQRWYPYREGYSIELVNRFIKELDITGNIFDPFVGSGTTLLSAKENNLNSFGIDINPISVLVAKVENEMYQENDIQNLQLEITKIILLEETNNEFKTSFNLADKVFNKDILNNLLYIKSHIRNIENIKLQNLIFVAWLSIIEEVSNIKKEGNGIKYKNRKRTKTGYINIDKEKWEEQTFPKNKFSFVKNKLLEKLSIILLDLKENYVIKNCKSNIIWGNCLKFDSYFTNEIQFTFYSPPYCNCFDYFEIHKVELWLGDFVKNKDELNKIRNCGFRSNTNSLNNKDINYRNEYLEKLISLIEVEKLWNKKIPEVIRGYFDDTHTLLNKLYHHTTSDGYVGIVVGNSAYTGVIIPTDILICNIAKEIGFKVEKVYITRHLTTSSQQKKALEKLKYFLRESVIILKK
jgi:hypothetical protein